MAYEYFQNYCPETKQLTENDENDWNNFSDSAFERAVVNELGIDAISVTQSSLLE